LSNQFNSTLTANYRVKHYFTVINSLTIGGYYGKGQFGNNSLFKYLANYNTITILKQRISVTNEINLSRQGEGNLIYNNSYGLNLSKEGASGIYKIGLGFRTLRTNYNRRDILNASYSQLLKYNVRVELMSEVHKVISKITLFNYNPYTYSISIKVQKTF
jgi:hypothetical protein